MNKENYLREKNQAREKYSGFYAFMAVIMIFAIVAQLFFLPIFNQSSNLYATENDNTVTGYGITNIKVPPFKYYEVDSKDEGIKDYHEYGTGIEYDWAIPEGAQAGDYFTLKFPPELTLLQKPMYKDNEEVPYLELDKLTENRYQKENDTFGIGSLKFYGPENGAQSWGYSPGMKRTVKPVIYRNELSVIKNKEGEPILKLYYTKKGEITFVVQKAAEGKILKGRGVIGHKHPNPENILAYTDEEARFYTTKQPLNRVYMQTKNNRVVQAADDSIATKTHYLGVLPNRELLTTDAGALRDQRNPYTHRKSVSFTTEWHSKQIGHNLSFAKKTHNVDVKINYQTELFKSWRVANYENNLGKETIYPVDYDGEYVTYIFTYGAHKYSWPNMPIESYGAKNMTIGGILTMSAPGNQTVPQDLAELAKGQRAQDKGFSNIDVNSIQLFQGYSGESSSQDPFSTFPVGLREITRGSSEYRNIIGIKSYAAAAGTQDVDWVNNVRGNLPKEWGEKTDDEGRVVKDPPDVWRRRPNAIMGNIVRENFNVFDFTPPNRSGTYVVKFRAKVNNTYLSPQSNELSAFMGMVTNSNTIRATSVNIRPSNAIGEVLSEVEIPENIIEHPGLRIKKLDHRNKQVLRDPNSAHPSAVIFRATDLETGFIFQSEIGNDGYITFPSLIRGHQYKLEEYYADETIFEKSNMLYKVIVNDDGTLRIEPYSENNSPLPPAVTSTSFPLASTDDPLIFNFKNQKNTSVRIKKVDEQGNLITTSPAVFDLYKPGEYNERVENGSTIITPKQGKTPREIRTEKNGRFGLSGLIELEPSANGVYALVERQSPEAAKVLREPIKFRVSDDLNIDLTTPPANRVRIEKDALDEEDNSVATNIVVSNNRTTSLIIRKYGEDGNTPLAGATFKLTNATSSVLYESELVTPDQTGEIIFTNLDPGNYILEEKQAPEGYERNRNGWNVVVRDNLRLEITKRDASVNTASSGSILSSLLSTSFRSASVDDPIPTPMPTVWYKNVDGQSFTVNHSPYTVNQNIAPVDGQQGRYKVTVTLGGKNQGMDIVMASHNSTWYPTEVNVFNADIIGKELTKFLKQKAIEKEVDIRLGIVTQKFRHIYDQDAMFLTNINDVVDSNWNIASLNSTDGAYMNFNFTYSKIAQVFNMKDDNVRRVLLHSLRRSIFLKGTSYGPGYGSETANIGNNRDSIKRSLDRVKYYLTWTTHKQSGHTYGPDRVLTDDGRQAYDDSTTGRRLIRNLINDNNNTNTNNNTLINYYKQVLTEELKTLGKGEMNLALSDAVVFDGFDDNANGTAKTNGYTFTNTSNNLKIGKISFPEGRSQTFSFYVRSNPNTELNVLKNIYSSATYQVVKNGENNDATRENNLSSPQVLMPGIVPRVTKTFDNSVPLTFRKDIPVVLKRGNEANKIQGPLNFITGSRNFDVVPKFDARGNDITYKVDFENLPSDYAYTVNVTPSTAAASAPASFFRENSTVNFNLSMSPLTIKATKEWQDKSRVTDPYDLDLRLKVFVDGKPVTAEADLRSLGITNIDWVTTGQRINKTDKGANLTKTFADLPRYRNDGAKISYAIEEYPANNATISTGANYYKTEYIYGKEGNDSLREVVTVRSEKYFIHEVTNKRSNTKFRIKKVDWKTGKLINADNNPVDSNKYPNHNLNTRFSLFKLKGELPIDPNRDLLVTTNEFAGEFELTNGDKGFEKGVYYLREERAPDGYWKLSRDIKINMAEDGSVSAEVVRKTGETGDLPQLDYVSVQKDDGWLNITVKNKPIYFDLEIDKKDESNNKLAGANFKLYSEATGTKDETSPHLVSLENTRFAFNSFKGKSIEPGTYYLEETAPNGYRGLSERLAIKLTHQGGIEFPNTKPDDVTFEVVEDYEWGPEKPSNDFKRLIRLAVVNRQKKYPFKLKKVDLDGGAPLNNATNQEINRVSFDFYRAEGQNFEDDDNHKLETFTFIDEMTHNEGYPAGTYYLKETQAPTNYHLFSKPIKVVIGTNGNFALSVSDTSYNNYVSVTQANAQNPATLTLRNQKILYDLEVKKVDENNTAINGSYFRLYKAETGNNGEMSPYDVANPVDNRSTYLFNTNVTPGVYYLEEVKSPAGFQKLKKRVRINLNSDGTVEIPDKQKGLIVFFGSDSIATDQGDLINGTGVNKKYEWGPEVADRNKRHGKIFVALKVVNKSQNTTIKLHKVDFSNPPKNLTGAKFKVYGPNDINTVFLNETAVSAQGDNIGELTIANLEKGSRYWIEETLAPNNYLRFPAKVEISIGQNGVPTLVSPDNNSAWSFRPLPNRTTYNENSEYHLQVKNRKLAFDVIKEGGTDPEATNLTPLNVRFNLYRATQAIANGPLAIDKNQRLATKKKAQESDTKITFTDENGLNTYGFYAISEDETDYPQGYKRYTEDIYFKLDQNGISLVDANNGNALANNKLENEWVRIAPLAAENNNDLPKFKIFNPLVKKLKLRKISSQANDVLLSGAEFKLYKLTDADNNVLPEDEAEREKRLLQTKTSGQDADLGKIVFADLLKGKYILKETNPPENYKLREKSYFFEVNAEGRFVFDETQDSPTALDDYFSLPTPRPDMAASEMELSFKNDPDNSDAFKILKVDADQRDGQDVLIGKQTGGPDDSSARFVLSATMNGEAVQFNRQVNGQNKKVGMQGDLVDGTLTLGSIPAGTYYLREERPPVGYLPIAGLIKIEHRNQLTTFSYLNGKNQDAKVIPLYKVSLRTKEVTKLDKPADMDEAEFTKYQKIFSVEREGDSTLYNVKVRNKKLKAVLKIYKKDINDRALSEAVFSIATKNGTEALANEDPLAEANNTVFTEIENLVVNDVVPSSLGEADNDAAAHIFAGTDGSGYGEGLYYLIEKVAPKGGYLRIRKAIPFYVNRDGSITMPALLNSQQPNEVQFDPTTGRARKDETFLPQLIGDTEILTTYLHGHGQDSRQLDNAKVLTQVVIKNRSQQLPYTGGNGVLSFILLGGGLCLLAFIGLVKVRKKEVV